MRTGLLADALAARGHQVTWFTSTFSHYTKSHRAAGDHDLTAERNLMIRVFQAPGYRSNISLRRIRHNRSFAQSFRRFASTSSEHPDVLVTDLPTTETAEAVVRFGTDTRTPTIVTIFDLWPDFFTDFLPAALRPFARVAIRKLDAEARFACRNATSLLGVSEGYLRWGQRKGDRQTTDHDRVVPLGYKPVPSASPDQTVAVLDKLGIPSDKQVVAFVGSWGATYDLELVYETCRLLARRNDILFVIAGDSETRPKLATAFGELPNVKLAGWIDSTTAAILLRRAAIGLLPYTAKAPQGLPFKLYDYMAYGVFQISTLGGEIAAFYDAIGIGRSLPGASPHDLAAAIEAALADPAIQSGREKRTAIFNNKYDADTVYSNMTEHVVEIARAGT